MKKKMLGISVLAMSVGVAYLAIAAPPGSTQAGNSSPEEQPREGAHRWHDDDERHPPRPPRPGVILSEVVQNELELSDEQKGQVAELQETVTTRLAEILSEDQQARLGESRDFGPPPPPRHRPAPQEQDYDRS